MKRLCMLLVLALLAIQFLLPATATGVFVGPSVITLPATDVGVITATLNADVSFPAGANQGGLIYVGGNGNGNGIACSGYFKYGTSPGVYTMSTPMVSLGFQSTGFSYAVKDLNPCTKYYVAAVLSCPTNLYYRPGPADGLIALLSNGLRYEEMRGLGIGMSPAIMATTLNSFSGGLMYGGEISFTTLGCQVGSGSHGTGSVGTPSATRPFLMSNIVVKTAAISNPRVSPGEKVEITANMVNQGGSNGDARVTMYVNGQEVESKGVTLTSGEARPVHFYISRNEPGTYSVYVGGVSAGSFVVDLFTNNDKLIYGLIALFTLGIGGILYLVTRRRMA